MPSTAPTGLGTFHHTLGWKQGGWDGRTQDGWTELGLCMASPWIQVGGMGPVIANPGCQLDYSWNQLKPKLLGTPVRDFLDWII